MGIELSGEVTTKMLLVPLGARNIPNWTKAFAISEDQFSEFMSTRRRRHFELAEAAAEANKQREQKDATK